MISRREILASGVAVSLLGPTLGATHGDASQRAAAARAAHFVADDRSPYARAAANAAAQRGATVLVSGPDITSLYAALDRRWETAPVAVAGVTSASALFALERLALDRGLRSVYRGRHRDAGRPALESELLGPAALVRRIEQAPHADFAAHLGRALADWTPRAGERQHGLRSLEPPSGADRAELASWLFVPKRV